MNSVTREIARGSHANDPGSARLISRGRRSSPHGFRRPCRANREPIGKRSEKIPSSESQSHMPVMPHGVAGTGED